jgi:hypothetical protein
MGCITPDLVRAAVAEDRELATSLFDALRQDGLNEPGVTRDPYGPGEQRAHETVAAVARQLRLQAEKDFAANTYKTLGPQVTRFSWLPTHSCRGRIARNCRTR